MTNSDFIEKVKIYRKKSQELIEGNGGFNIKRGMAHTISGYVEDLFALYIAENKNCSKTHYLVDKVISIRFNVGEKAKSFKPDLAILNENVLTHYFDLKTNMGWNRHFEPYLKEKHDFIEKLKSKKAWIRFGKDQVQNILVSKEIKYQMVVVFGWNINQDLLKENLKLAKKYTNVKVHVLYIQNEEEDSYMINNNAFSNILNSL